MSDRFAQWISQGKSFKIYPLFVMHLPLLTVQMHHKPALPLIMLMDIATVIKVWCQAIQPSMEATLISVFTILRHCSLYWVFVIFIINLYNHIIGDFFRIKGDSIWWADTCYLGPEFLDKSSIDIFRVSEPKWSKWQENVLDEEIHISSRQNQRYIELKYSTWIINRSWNKKAKQLAQPQEEDSKLRKKEGILGLGRKEEGKLGRKRKRLTSYT